MLDVKDPAKTLMPGIANVFIPPIGHYDLRREIARSGMSTVYEARDRRTGREIALKLLTLPPSLTSDEAVNLVTRFEREARTAARLSHPNVIKIHEIGVHQGRHFLAMEYLRGQTLRERLKESAFTYQEALPILTQVAGALDAAHQAGIVHRDVKPANVMLLPDGTVKLLDFGIAQSRDETTITHVGVIIGSPSYMAPEQITGEPGTAAMDVWALGVLSYELLAGHLPFTGQTIGSVLYQIMHQPPVPMPTLSVSAQKVLRRALSKRPAQRYQSAGALVLALKAALTEPSPKAASRAAFRLPAVSTPRLPAVSTPRWLPGAALACLFLLGFCGTALERRHASERALQKTASHSPVLESAGPRVFQAPLPDALPVPIPDPVAASQPNVQIVPLKHQAASLNGLTPPRPVKTSSPQARQAAEPLKPFSVARRPLPIVARRHLPPVQLSRSKVALAQTRVPLPVQPHRLPVTLKQAAVRQVSLATVVRHRPVQSTNHYAAARTAAQTAPVQTAPPSVPAQTTVQESTLPPDRSSYDPEADARLRKLAWSQNGSSGNP